MFDNHAEAKQGGPDMKVKCSLVSSLHFKIWTQNLREA